MRKAVLPIIGVLAIGAGLIGMQLGQSAIANIDPIHFQGAPRPAQEIVRDAAALSRAPVYADAYGWEAGQQARAADCGGDCPAFAARQSQAALPGPSLEVASLSAPMRPSAESGAEDFDDAFEVPPSAEARLMSRYLHYPVTPDQAAQARRAPARTDRPTAATAEAEAGDPTGL